MKVNLAKALFIIPNLFTLGSVLCGFVAILICTDSASDQTLYNAAMLIFYAMFFDSLDGRVARLTKTQSAIGVQLDSLADVMSFGVAPSILVYRWSLNALGPAGIAIGFVYIACGAIRLARFNVQSSDDSGQPLAPTKYFQGLPIPVAAGILISIVVTNVLTGKLPFSPMIIGAVVVAISILMVSTLPFRSFKDIRVNARSLSVIALVVGVSIVVAVTQHPSIALGWLLVTYIAIGVLDWLSAWLSKRSSSFDDSSS